MPSERTILLDRQKRVFRIACDPRRYGLTLQLIAAESGLGYDSIRHYASGETMMPLSAFTALMGVLPAELLSHLLPEGFAVVQVPDGFDHDAIGELAQGYLDTKMAAHRTDSPAGPAICPEREKPELDGKVARLRAA